MFCRQCGAEVPENNSFCPKCGARIGDEAAPNDKESVISLIVEKIGEIFGYVIAIAIIALALFHHFAPGSLTPEWALNKFGNNILLGGDYDKIRQVYPKDVIDVYGESNIKETFYDDNSPYLELQLGMEYMEDEGWDLKFKATSHSILGNEEKKQVEQLINDRFGTTIEISDAATVDFKLVATKKKFLGLFGGGRQGRDSRFGEVRI